MHASQVTPEVAARANELYWSSPKSVNQIADDLDLSKGTLYGLIEPEPSGRACPMCGDEVEYANRTAKDRSMLACPTCAWDGQPAETVELVPDEEGPADSPSEARRPVEAAPARAKTPSPRSEPGEIDAAADTVPPPPPHASPLATTIAGGALIGAAVGLALVFWARRR